MKQLVGEHAEFFRQYRVRFQTTGAVAPSSRFLARALTRPLAARKRPVRILEVGPGTGAVTRRIARMLGPEDQLDLVELNDAFVALLTEQFAARREFRSIAGRFHLHHCPIQQFAAAQPYDIIISGLPLNNFSDDLAREILDALLRLLAPGGSLSYFEYMYMRPLRRAVSNRQARERLDRLDALLEGYLRRYRFSRDWVFANIPPAWVQHLRHGGGSAECGVRSAE